MYIRVLILSRDISAPNRAMACLMKQHKVQQEPILSLLNNGWEIIVMCFEVLHFVETGENQISIGF